MTVAQPVTDRPTRPCWGEFEVPEGAWAAWRIGPTELWCERRERDWRVVTKTGSDPLAQAAEARVPAEAPNIGLTGKVARFASPASNRLLTVAPRTADRPVVVRPFEPFFLPPEGEVTLYVTVPLWIQLSCRNGGEQRILTEFPAYRPSDTWVGPPTREGELAYASRIACYLSLEELPLRPHRSVTAVRIRNHSEVSLPLERLNIPLPRLSLYRSRDGKLWTQDVALDRRGATDFAELRLEAEPPAHATAAERVAGPRSMAKGAIFRAFGTFLR